MSAPALRGEVRSMNANKKMRQLLTTTCVSGKVEPYPELITSGGSGDPFLVTLYREDQVGDTTYEFVIYVASDREHEPTLESAILGLFLRANDVDHHSNFREWVESHEDVPTSYGYRLWKIMQDAGEDPKERRRAHQKLWSDYWYLRALQADLRTIFGAHYDNGLDTIFG